MTNDCLELVRALPDGWSEVEVVEDEIVADSVELRRAGIATRSPAGEEVTGSAASSGETPLPRSCFELLERVSTLEAIGAGTQVLDLWTLDRARAGARCFEDIFPESSEPGRWRYARSNGVALHRGWSRACFSALCELVERDHVLRAWYGETLPRRVALHDVQSPLDGAGSYDVRAYEFPAPAGATWAAGVRVAGVFGFPRRDDVPFFVGFGARATLREALEAASLEASQLLAFLWGEPLPEALPAPGPRPVDHLDRYLCRSQHGVLAAWLDGSHAGYGRSATASDARAEVRFADLTPAWLPDGLVVAKAVCDAAVPLAFGDAPFAAHLPSDLRIHPIA